MKAYAYPAGFIFVTDKASVTNKINTAVLRLDVIIQPEGKTDDNRLTENSSCVILNGALRHLSP